MQTIVLRSTDKDFKSKVKKLSWEPKIAMVSFEQDWKPDEHIDFLVESFEQIKIFGSSSSQGFMDSQGVLKSSATATIMLIGGDSLDAGIASLTKDSCALKLGENVINMACKDAGRSGQTPSIIFMFSCPGDEELVIEGICNMIGQDTPIIGGSSGDNSISGNWKQLSGKSYDANLVSILAIYSDEKISTYFHSGFGPTTFKGIATKVEAREIIEIDGFAAAKVYNEWTQEAMSDSLLRAPSTILAQSSLFPIGRKTDSDSSSLFYKLSHPETITKRHGLTTFTTIEQGEEITLMSGTYESIIERTLRVLEQAQEIEQIEKDDIKGVVLTFCAGCMMTLGPRINEVYELIEDKFLKSNIPLISFFTFGEQGHIANEENIHGNLMISAVLLTDKT
ncbi:MAG: FIST C-terminal domain-containing protein [Bacteriovoracaceae bacterium]|nr:FIST C-terminal domain-containing protein [Bacteriovoracaceae bacterium]